MANKSLSQILEGQEVLLNSVISLLDSNETSSQTVRPMLEFLRQDIKGHLQDLQGPSIMTQRPEGCVSVGRLRNEVDPLRTRLSESEARLSKLEDRMESVQINQADHDHSISILQQRFPEEERL